MTSKSNQERLAVLEEKTDSIEKKLDQHILDSKSFHVQLLDKLENLDDRYPTRREFKAANWLFGIIISIIGVAVALIKL